MAIWGCLRRMSQFTARGALHRGIVQRMPHLAKCIVLRVTGGTDARLTHVQYGRQMSSQ
jgi:hypothetical protein